MGSSGTNFQEEDRVFLSSSALEWLKGDDGIYMLFGEDGETYIEVFYPVDPNRKRIMQIIKASTDMDRLEEYANSAWARQRNKLDFEGL